MDEVRTGWLKEGREIACRSAGLVEGGCTPSGTDRCLLARQDSPVKVAMAAPPGLPPNCVSSGAGTFRVDGIGAATLRKRPHKLEDTVAILSSLRPPADLHASTDLSDADVAKMIDGVMSTLAIVRDVFRPGGPRDRSRRIHE